MADNRTEFTVKLADIPVRIHAIWPEMRRFLRDYLTEEEAELSIVTRQEDIERERVMSAKTRAAEGRPQIKCSDAYLETLAIYRKLAEALVERDVLLFHGSVVAVDGEAYLFTAKSGTGKSTHTRLWREAFGERSTSLRYLFGTHIHFMPVLSSWLLVSGVGIMICYCFVNRISKNNMLNNIRGR